MFHVLSEAALTLQNPPIQYPSTVTQKTLRDGHKVRIKWLHVSFFATWHLAALGAIFYFSWSALIATAVLLWICGGLGITLGFHRLLTHRSFQTYKPVEYFLTLCGTLTWQGGPAHWVGTHRLHHKESDLPGDPHSPHDGFGWSHMLWMLYSHHPGENPRSAAQDILRDKGQRIIDKLWYLPQAIVTLILAGIGYSLGGTREALAWFFWAGILRVVLMYHFTWFVNSASHTWGYRNFQTRDASRNNWWVALLSFGEGWHNNHHAQQRSAAHGMRWFEFDITYLTILTMEKFGLAWKVVRPLRPGAPERLPTYAVQPLGCRPTPQQ
jgi:sn-1 stearoyl-lipid 9-desaturase